MHEVHPYGDRALLVTELAAPAAFAMAVRDARLPVLDVATGADSVMVLLRHSNDVAATWAALSRLSINSEQAPRARQIQIPVAYDGADLDEVAAITGLAPQKVIDLHTSAEFTVAFCGFAPGFAYLTGLPKQLHVPRLPTPRTEVPAGAVAIAAEFSGVYPRRSPGGWRLLGTTSVELFNVDADPPALLTPGDRVRFVAQ